MSPKTSLLGSLEQQVMDVLWQVNKPLKPLEVLQRLKGDYAYTTIMTVLKRLADKKFICRRLAGKAYFYSPYQCQNEFVKENLSDIFGGLVDSYGKLAISQFVDVIKNNKDDMELLKEYLDANQ